MQCVEWALLSQEPSGAWSNFFFIYPENPYGAMAQGEGASLLLRGYRETQEKRYLDAARRAIDFMLLPKEEGGATLYEDGHVVLLEYTHLPAVMNGWIFAWWGLYDYVLVSNDNHCRTILDTSLKSLQEMLPRFSKHHWSMYDLNGHIASPFYHHLHIAQMEAMHRLTEKEIFSSFATKWRRCEGNIFYKTHAFIIKAWQKIIE